ncbi:MAG TPA: hypothetical protein VGR62_12830 [Candidatus Binatia bacterium]|jgi:hypothetical protein|nr:hypothetical protein [Candidatus Binatia bacterium]
MRYVTRFVVLALVLAALPASAQPLDRDLSSYFVLALRKAALKNLSLSGACNVGVNCASPIAGAVCGSMRLDEVSFGPGTQSVADKQFFTKPGAQVFQVFRNGGGPLDNVTIAQPPPEPFTTPIIPDTCSADCVPDIAKVEEACGFPNPFPACDATKPVLALPGLDCSAFDTQLGNGQCDLAPGTYGAITAQNAARISFAPGSYAVCSFHGGRNVLVLGTGVTLTIPDPGFFRVNNGSAVGMGCDGFVIQQKGTGTISFGRKSSVAARVCAPEALIRLGHGNVLTGQFIGDVVLADLNNLGECCGLAGMACTCFDAFAPTSAHVGDIVTLTSQCDLNAGTAVRICGITTPILTQLAGEITVAVPPGAIGACAVEIDSSAGVFEHVTKLLVL